MNDSSEISGRLSLLAMCQLLLVFCVLLLFVALSVLDADLVLVACELRRVAALCAKSP